MPQKDSQVLIRVPESVREEFKVCAQAQNRTMSELIRGYMDRTIQKAASKNA